MKPIKRLFDGELRCWICKRNAQEVKEAVGIDLGEAIKSRNKMELDNKCKEGEEVIQLVDTELTGLDLIPLCIVCQGVLLYQGAEAADMVIDDKLLEGELMPYTEYEIKEKEREDD